MASTNGIEAGLSIYQSTTVVSVELNNGNKLSGMLNIEQGTVTLMQGR